MQIQMRKRRKESRGIGQTAFHRRLSGYPLSTCVDSRLFFLAFLLLPATWACVSHAQPFAHTGTHRSLSQQSPLSLFKNEASTTHFPATRNQILSQTHNSSPAVRLSGRNPAMEEEEVVDVLAAAAGSPFTDISGLSRKDWMAHYKGLTLSQLSLPGTAKSTMYDVENEEDGRYRFQDRNIGQQLKDGIRFFDIHAWRRLSDGKWYSGFPKSSNVSHHYTEALMVHSKQTLEESLFKPVRDFVQQHPSEVLLIRFTEMYCEFNVSEAVPRWDVQEEKKAELYLMIRTYWGSYVAVRKSPTEQPLSLVSAEPGFQDSSRVAFNDYLKREGDRLLLHTELRILVGTNGEEGLDSWGGGKSVQVIVFVQTSTTALRWMRGSHSLVLRGDFHLTKVAFKHDLGGVCFEHLKDYYGDDLEVGGMSIPTARDCQRHCQDHKEAGCRYFTFTTHDHRCWLKHGKGKKMYHGSAISGPAICLLGNDEQQPISEDDIIKDIKRQMTFISSDVHTDPKLMQLDLSEPVALINYQPNAATCTFSNTLSALFDWFTEKQTTWRDKPNHPHHINLPLVAFYNHRFDGNRSYFDVVMQTLNHRVAQAEPLPRSRWPLLAIASACVIAVVFVVSLPSRHLSWVFSNFPYFRRFNRSVTCATPLHPKASAGAGDPLYIESEYNSLNEFRKASNASQQDGVLSGSLRRSATDSTSAATDLSPDSSRRHRDEVFAGFQPVPDEEDPEHGGTAGDGSNWRRAGGAGGGSEGGMEAAQRLYAFVDDGRRTGGLPTNDRNREESFFGRMASRGSGGSMTAKRSAGTAGTVFGKPSTDSLELPTLMDWTVNHDSLSHDDADPSATQML